MKQGIEYHRALQSAFSVGYDFNDQLGARYKIMKLTWAFYLNKTSVGPRAKGVQLANTTTPSEDRIQIKLSVTDQAFSKEEITTPIPALTKHLEDVIYSALGVLNSRILKDGGWATHGTVVEVEFMIDEQQEIQFSGFAREVKSVIHTLKFMIRAMSI